MAPFVVAIVHGLITVKDKVKTERQHAVLIDTGATESCISEAFVSEE